MLLSKMQNLKVFKNYIKFITVKKGHKILANNLQISFHKNLNNAFIQFLKKSVTTSFNQITDLTAIDNYNKNNNRFIISYFLLSEKYCSRIILRITANGISSIKSISSIFKGSNWLEREVFDLFGIFFKNNVDLRRILTDYGFKGYPLRKDYPIYGFTEKYYSIADNIILTNPVAFLQEFRFEQRNIDDYIYKFDPRIIPF